MTVSIVLFIRCIGLMVHRNCWIFWRVLYRALLCRWGTSILYSLRMLLFRFIRFRRLIFFMSIWWDVRCCFWLKILRLDCFYWMGLLNIGLLLTLRNKLCSFLNSLKFLKLVRFRDYNRIFQRFLKNWLNVFLAFIYKLLIEQCAFLKMITFWIFWKHTNHTHSLS